MACKWRRVVAENILVRATALLQGGNDIHSHMIQMVPSP